MWANGITPGTAHRFLLEIFFLRTDFRLYFLLLIPPHLFLEARQDGAGYLKEGCRPAFVKADEHPSCLRPYCTFVALLSFVNLLQKESW